jgi:hypothetical protein
MFVVGLDADRHIRRRSILNAARLATKDHVDTVVTREVQGLRVEMTQQIQNLRVELSDKLTMQFRWLLGWLAVVTVGILLDLLR